MIKNCFLGISAFYHDSAAVVMHGPEIIAAAHEERFTRLKHDPSFPQQAIRYVLKESGLNLEDFTAIAFYDKPFLKFERLLETYHAFAPKGIKSFLSAMPVWIKEKMFMKRLVWDELASIHGKRLNRKPPLLFPECTAPTYLDFLYFAFVIGTSGQTADVAFASGDMRFKGMIHCVVAYVFNAAVLGLSINIAAGIIGGK